MEETDNMQRERPSEPYEFKHPVEVMEPEEDDLMDIRDAGDKFVRVLEWIHRGDTLSRVGMRAVVVAYLIRPELIGNMTYEEIGGLVGKTRQDVGILVSDFRDTFGGLQFRNNRSETTRRRSRDSHLKHHEQDK